MHYPKASIILPVYQRTSTLSTALKSIQNQTIKEIEIVVVMDGATPECKNIIQKHAILDDRFKVLDLPKGSGAGKDNVHQGVMEANASSIFYTDDDDLLLPYHIEKLLPILDRNHIVDSRVCTLDIYGGLHTTPCPGESPLAQKLLRQGKLKMIFDTHIAHQKSIYGDKIQWTSSPNYPYGPVWSFLAGICHYPSIKWESIEEITAISIHGAVRKDWSFEQRKNEIQHWYSLIETERGMLDKLLEDTSMLYYLFQLLYSSPPTDERDQELSTYLHRHNGYKNSNFSTQELNLFSLFKGDLKPNQMIGVIEELSKPVIAGYLFEQLAAVLVSNYSESVTNPLLELLEDEVSSTKLAGMYGLIACLYHYKSNNKQAIKMIEQGIELGPDPVNHLSSYFKNVKNDFII